MRHEALIAVICNVVGTLVVLTAFGWPTWLALLAIPVAALGLVGWWWMGHDKLTLGARTLIGSSVLLLPVGAVGIYAGIKALQYQKYGVHLGRRREAEPTPRPRAWTLAAALFGVVSAGALVVTLVRLRGTLVADWTDLLELGSLTLLAVIAAVEAGLLWGNQDGARRLGVGLCVVAVCALALSGFYLHSYVALALLGVPVYGLLLVVQGHRRWRGLESNA